jgi:hypothetical protein
VNRRNIPEKQSPEEDQQSLPALWRKALVDRDSAGDKPIGTIPPETTVQWWLSAFWDIPDNSSV